MDFVVGLPRTRREHDLKWFIVDRLTKFTHFLLVNVTFLEEDYAKICIKDTMKLHGSPLSIIS